MSTIIMTNIENQREKPCTYFSIPDECPICHKSIQPIIQNAYAYDTSYIINNKRHSQVVFQCPNHNCKKLFIAEYESFGDPERELHFENVFPNRPQNKEFSDQINAISSNFSVIYNQAFFAEQYELNQICGTGYRKALEFLVKDFAISMTDSEPDKERIKKKFLANVINEHFTDPNIKKVASRATWLGNDETHYLKIWEKQDLNDLKILIDLTIHWIEMNKLTSLYEEQMPDQ